MPFGRLVKLCVVALVCVAVPASAQIPISFFIVPVVVKAPGLNDSNWGSDLFLSNLGDDDRAFSAHFFPAKVENTFDGDFARDNVSVRAGDTLQVTDVIGTWFPSAGSNTKGWLVVADTTPVDCDDDDRTTAQASIATRVYNSVGGGATYGMIVESSMLAVNPTSYPSVFTGVRHQGENAKPGFRSSVGVANISTVWTSVEFTLYDHSGALKGQATKGIKPLSMMQWSLEQLGFPVLGNRAGRLEVRIVDPNLDPCAESSSEFGCMDICDPECEGAYGFGAVQAIVPYVSNTDNLTGDGETILPVVDLMSFYAWANDYMETHCPEEKSGSLLEDLMRRVDPYLDGRDRMPPVFRKVE